MSPAELERLGQESLREHLMAQAVVAHRKHGPVCTESLEGLLGDPGCVRHPVRVVFEFGEMAMHQFAQPDVDWRDPQGNGRVLYLRPSLKQHPELLPLAVAYMIPLINFGEIVTDAHCLAYGAVLLGMTEDEYHAALCAMSDAIGAVARPAGAPDSTCCD